MKKYAIVKSVGILLLSILLLAGILAGCTQTPPVSENDDSEEPQTSSEPSENADEHHLTVMGRDRRYDEVPFADRDQYPTWQAVEKLLADNGVFTEFELIPTEQYDTVLQTRLAAANDLPDIVNLGNTSDTDAVRLGQQGVIIDVMDAMEKYSNGNTQVFWGEYWADIAKRFSTEDGALYWYPSLMFKFVDGKPLKGTSIGFEVRKDWIDKLGLEVPETTDDLYNLTKAFQEMDANSNGQKDEIIDVYMDRFDNGLAQMYGLAPGLIQFDKTTNEIVTPWYQPGIRDYIEFVKKCIDGGIMDPSLLGAANESPDSRVAENKTGGLFTYIVQFWLEPMVTAEEAVYYPVLLQGNEDIQPALFQESSAIMPEKYVITKNCEDVEGAVRLFDTLYTDEYAELSYWGVEDISFKWENDRRVSLTLGMTDKEVAEKKMTVGHTLCGHQVFPYVNITEEYGDLMLLNNQSQEKQDFENSHQEYENIYYSNMPLAMFTEEEREIVEKYNTTINTYSTELLTDLILGNRPLDELDSAIEEMKELGLDELLSVYKSSHERFNTLK